MTHSTPDFIESATIMSLLRSIGLTKYEALAYLTLLKAGPQNCKTLTRLTGIPCGKIYTVMKTLVNEGWVLVSFNERPKVFYAEDPEIAISKRIATLKEKLNHLEKSANRVLPILKPLFGKYSLTEGRITSQSLDRKR